jgi:hypothetical protein
MLIDLLMCGVPKDVQQYAAPPQLTSAPSFRLVRRFRALNSHRASTSVNVHAARGDV